MKRFSLLLPAFFVVLNSLAQINFQAAYQNHPDLPHGILEAVSFTQTRMQEIGADTQVSCSGMPLPYGIMGLFENGASYFKENGKLVATFSGISVEDQKSSVSIQIEAYAKAFSVIYSQEKRANLPRSKGENIYRTLCRLSEIPDSGTVNLFARDAQVFEIMRFMNDSDKAQTYNFGVHHFDLPAIFGKNNYKVLSAGHVNVSSDGIENELRDKYSFNQAKSIQYPPAIWNPAPTCNYSSRNGIAVSAITIHTIQGTYAGAISWSQNCNSNVSYHYVIRSSDGQVTQMVDEANKAWHVGSENPYTIGYEHEGYVDNPVWYTEAMYNSSADLSRDVINSGYGIPGLRTYYGASSASIQVLGGCTKIKGHQHYPNQTHTDPGINWNWEKYYRLINNNPNIQTITTASGNFYDSGGSAGSYTDDERLLWLFQPANANSVTLNFSSFNVESGYDRLFIYDGSTVNAPLIGSYTGNNSPGTVSSSSGSLLVEFRSDCGTVATGWAAAFSSTSSDDQAPTTAISANGDWQTNDFTVNFTDADNIGVVGRYYLVADRDPSNGKWSSNGEHGFCNELFGLDAALWTDVTGDYTFNNGTFTFSDIAQQNSNTFYSVNQDNSTAFLYEWNQTISSTSTNQRAGLHFFCDDPTLPNRGNSYFVFFRETEQKAQIYKVTDDVFSMKTNDNCVVTANVNYTYRVTYNPQSGWIKVYVGNQLVTQWQDIEPLQSGNSISLRTGGCSATFDNIRVFRSRGTSANISIGNNAMIRYQSEGAIASGAARSMAVDEIGNWSEGVSEVFLIDWTAPVLTFLNDGNGNDIDTNYSTTLEANWLADDIHSGIGNYEVAIGLLPSLNNVLNWTDVSLDEAFSHVLTSPVYDQVYHISLRIKNSADLEALYVSDGQRLVDPNDTSLLVNESALQDLNVFPNPVQTEFYLNEVASGAQLFLYDTEGKLVLEKPSYDLKSVDVSYLSQGVYQLVIRKGNSFVVRKLLKE